MTILLNMVSIEKARTVQTQLVSIQNVKTRTVNTGESKRKKNKGEKIEHRQMGQRNSYCMAIVQVHPQLH